MSVLHRALSQYGVTEIPGPANNPNILSYFNYIGHTWVQGEETAWCSAFANWVCKKEGKPYSGSLTARSWLDVGEHVFVPKLGDIVVLWRESPTSWKGHVGFYINHDDAMVYVLGGNQDNQVNIKAYPRVRVLEYRRL